MCMCMMVIILTDWCHRKAVCNTGRSLQVIITARCLQLYTQSVTMHVDIIICLNHLIQDVMWRVTTNTCAACTNCRIPGCCHYVVFYEHYISMAILGCLFQAGFIIDNKLCPGPFQKKEQLASTIRT